MAIDFSFGGIGLHADPTNVSVSIGDLAGPGSGLDINIHNSPDGEPIVSIGGAPTLQGPEGDLESLLGQQSQDTSSAHDAGAETAHPIGSPNTFDPATLSSLTLLGGIGDTGLDNDLHHLPGA